MRCDGQAFESWLDRLCDAQHLGFTGFLACALAVLYLVVINFQKLHQFILPQGATATPAATGVVVQPLRPLLGRTIAFVTCLCFYCTSDKYHK